MNRKRILFLSHYGANPQFQEFFAETARQGNFDVKVIIPREIIYTNGYRPQRFPERKVIDGVEYIPSNLFDARQYHLSGYYPELPKTILSFRPHIVIVTDEIYTMDTFFVVLYKLLFFRRYEIITWSQANYVEDRRTIRKEGQYLLLFNKPFVRKYVARNIHQAERIRKVLPKRKRVQHVYWSTNPEKFRRLELSREELREQCGVSLPIAGKRILGFVGRVVSEKGVFDVIQLLPKLPDDVVFLIVGQGDETYIEEMRHFLRDNHLESRCEFLGDKEYGDVVLFYNLLDIFLLPTKDYKNFYELFGRVLAEAMMCKTMVLGSDNGAIPEVIDNPRCVFPQNHPEVMLARLQDLLSLSEEGRRALIEKNYQHAVQHFTVEAFARNLISLINA